MLDSNKCTSPKSKTPIMKKQIILALSLFLSLTMQAAVSKTVNVTNPGTLIDLLTVEERTTITDLSLTGNISASDFLFMRDNLTALTSLDLSGVAIQAYTGIDGPRNPITWTYGANQIPYNAFYNSNVSGIPNTTLKSVVLPSNLDSIGEYAFYQSQIASVTFGGNEKVIGAAAFQKCYKLTSVAIPNSVTKLGVGAFQQCTTLVDLTIGTGITTIPNSGFGGCSILPSVIIPPSVSFIDSYAFLSCYQLKTVYTSNPVPASMGVYVFYQAPVGDVFVPTDVDVTTYRANSTWIGFFPGTIIKKGVLASVSEQTSSELKVYSAQSSIVVDGAEAGSLVNVYTIAGTKLQTIKSQGEKLYINVAPNTMYVIQVDGQAFKVMNY